MKPHVLSINGKRWGYDNDYCVYECASLHAEVLYFVFVWNHWLRSPEGEFASGVSSVAVSTCACWFNGQNPVILALCLLLHSLSLNLNTRTLAPKRTRPGSNPATSEGLDPRISGHQSPLERSDPHTLRSDPQYVLLLGGWGRAFCE